MTTTFALINQKGGVGKTVSAVNLADLIALTGVRTLLIDADPQGNVADCLGLPSGGEITRLLDPDQFATVADVAVPSGRPNLDVIRADKTAAQIVGAHAVFALADKLEDADYEAIFIDCAPTITSLQPAALVAADWLIVPTRLDQLAINGVRMALQSLASVKRASRCALAGILPTFYDRQTAETHRQLTHLVTTFQNVVYPPIPMDQACRIAPRFGQTLREYAPKSRALLGIANGSGPIGGYVQAAQKIKELL